MAYYILNSLFCSEKESSPVKIAIDNHLFCVDSNDPFSDGHTTGYLEFYDERHRPPFPLTSQGILEQFKMILSEPSSADLWKAGRITGWIEALIENASETFKSFLLEEHMGVLQRM
jgi:hypothetical protein